ncbi:MAG: hypothetical protein ACYDG6_08955 [Thermincolia bacterium]
MKIKQVNMIIDIENHYQPTEVKVMRPGQSIEKQLYDILEKGKKIIKDEVDNVFSQILYPVSKLAQVLLQGNEIRPEEITSMIDFNCLHNRLNIRLKLLIVPVNCTRLDDIIPRGVDFEVDGLNNRAKEFRNTLVLDAVMNKWLEKSWHKALLRVVPVIPKALSKRINPGKRARDFLFKDDFNHGERCLEELTRCLYGYLTNLRIRVKSEMVHRFEKLIFRIYDEMVCEQENHLSVAAM